MEAQGRFAASEARQGLDLVIIGAGPAGLSAALETQARGLRFVVLERAKAASTVRAFPPGKKVYAEPHLKCSQTGAGDQRITVRALGLPDNEDIKIRGRKLRRQNER